MKFNVRLLLMSAVFLCSQSFAGDLSFAIKPYLFSIKGEKIAVAWRYTHDPDSDENIEVKLLRSDKEPSAIKAEKNLGLYFAILPLETCGFTNVSYQVTGMSKNLPINEVPCESTGGASAFSFIADTQEGPEQTDKFAEKISRLPNSFLIHGGDIIQNSDKNSEWETMLLALAPALSSQILLPVVGNHEYRGDNKASAFKQYFQTEARDNHYAFFLGGVHIIVMNSCFEDDSSQKDTELSWIKTELIKPAPWKVVIFHHPPFSKGLAHISHAPKKEHLILREFFVPLFEQFKVDLVLSGHTHLYEHSIKDGIHYVTTGPGGGKIGFTGAANPYSVLLSKVRTFIQVDANDVRLRATAITLDDTPIDDIVIEKHL